MSSSKSNRSARRGRAKSKSSILPILEERSEELAFQEEPDLDAPSRSIGIDLSSENLFDPPPRPQQKSEASVSRHRSSLSPSELSFSFEEEEGDPFDFKVETQTQSPRTGRSNQAISPLEDNVLVETLSTERPGKQAPVQKASAKKPLTKKRASKTQTESAQVSLLSDFWTELGREEIDKEEDRFNEFFEDSVHNSKSGDQDQEDSVSKRIQVGLYPADAELLEELFQQSKAAGLKNVSRARILRVALRHFHTCWLNADQNA